MYYGKRPIGIFDLTNRCPLRCRHCYYYTNVSAIPAELDRDAFLERLAATRDRYGIRSAFWIGGEPLLEPDLLRRAMDLFARNAVATSGALPIPADLGAGLLVSVDGPEAAHDALRGEGTFALAMQHIRALPERSFAIATTLTSSSVDSIDAFPHLVESTRALGILVGFHVGRPGDPSRLDDNRRDRAVDELLRIHDANPGVLLHSRRAIELFRPRYSAEIAKKCIYRDVAIAFDVRFGVKSPCTFAENAACDACGCPVVISHAAWRDSDVESKALLHALFPKRQGGRDDAKTQAARRLPGR
ncbi:MAG: radical SAM protein [Candidatus Krumholzibacteriia bacterium]